VITNGASSATIMLQLPMGTDLSSQTPTINASSRIEHAAPPGEP